MPIKVGDALPSVEVFENSPGEKVNVAELFKGKKGVLIALPGAFTPNCTITHLPGYIADYNKLKAKGVDVVACLSVNDPFVMAAWGKALKADGKITMLADTCGEFTKAVDMELAAAIPILGNMRSKRYALVIEDSVVTAVNVEPDGMGVVCSLSNHVLDQL